MDPEITELDEFASAFADLTSPLAAGATAETPPADADAAAATAAAAAATPETPPADADAAAATAAAAAAAATAETPPADADAAAAATAAAAAAAAATPPADAAAARIAALEAELAAARKPAAPAAAATQAAATQAAAEPAPLYNADEQALLTEYQKAWPDIHAGEALVRRAEYRDLVGYIFNQVRQQLAPIQEFTQRQQGRTQYSDLVELVPDYDDVRDKTLAWVETQPDYLKEAYKKVTSTGSAADVADLIDRFKKETGYVQPAAKAATTAAPAATTAALPAAAKAAVAALKVVKSGRTEAIQAVDPDNFDAAFAEFTAAK